jgi:DNA-binding GntR family transcriptional regulator
MELIKIVSIFREHKKYVACKPFYLKQGNWTKQVRSPYRCGFLRMSELESSNGAAVAIQRRHAELVALLVCEIVMARVAPEKRLTLTQVCRLIQADKTEIEPVVADLASKQLLTREGDSVIIAAVDRTRLLPRLEERLVIEQAVAHAAANSVSSKDIEEMMEAVSMLKRSAMVGDIDGYITADRRLERAIGAASGAPEKVEELAVIKREFRRAWCAFNRLRDLNVPAKLRQTLVEAIIAGKPDDATAAVRSFIEYLRKSF